MVDATPVFLPASPLQYLKRLQLQNQIFGDNFSLLGFQRNSHNLRIVTEQPHVAGAAPEWAELDSLLNEQHGLVRLKIPPMGHYKSYSYLCNNIGVFDVHPANCVLTVAGELVPIDFILVEFDEETVRVLGNYLRGD